MKPFFLLLSLSLIVLMLPVQLAWAQDWEWAKSGGGLGPDEGNGLFVDENGNSYVIGQFSGNATFGTTILSPTQSVTAFSDDALFMAKYNVSGSLLWVKKISDSNLDLGKDIAVDAKGNIYVTGGFSGTVQFGSTTLTSNGFGDMFLAKYSNNGNLIWVKKAGGASFTLANSLALDAVAGTINVTGYFRATANFGGISLTSTGKDNIFLVKFDEGGNVIWAKNAGRINSSAESYDIAVDGKGNSYITGVFYGPIFFDNVLLSGSNSPFNLSDSFVAKYDPAGNALWAKQVNCLSEDFPGAIKVDKDGNCYVTGNFKGLAQIGNTSLTSNGPEYDIYLTKYTDTGQEVWAKKFGGPAAEEAGDITLSISNEIYLTGNFKTTATFGQAIVSSEGDSDIFIAQITSANGDLQMLLQAGGSLQDRVKKIALDPNANIYLIGSLKGTARFGNLSLTSAGDTDFFISKYGLPFTGESTVKLQPIPVIDLCKEKEINIFFDASGPFNSDNTYTVVLSDAFGSFSTPRVVGTGKSSPVLIQIPENTLSGTDYRLKIITTSPAISNSGNELVFTLINPGREVIIPNIITPNGDNLNDAFSLLIPCQTPDLKIYNRWGRLVYSQLKYQNTWKAEDVGSGTYYYYITGKNGAFWKGWLEVIK